uniref:Uncharacterized protein n=1 Tax=Manihot esculenta TaxID=3983 RepID=A0A2C9V644_MANES
MMKIGKCFYFHYVIKETLGAVLKENQLIDILKSSKELFL